jgi:formylglycine-generating enzyme required for sulfatase activity
MPKANRDLPANPSFVKGNDLPVTMVTWEEAMEFAERLSRKTGRRYRLPSEAEWEYACRGGTTTRFHFGETITPTLVNYDGNYPFGSAPKGMVRQRPTPVGAMGVANAFGLYDMHGNVWEFCLDPWHGTYSGAPSNGSAWEQGGDLTYRVIRGGGWHNRARFCRSAYRFRSGPEVRGNGLGLRLLRASP